MDGIREDGVSNRKAEYCSKVKEAENQKKKKETAQINTYYPGHLYKSIWGTAVEAEADWSRLSER